MKYESKSLYIEILINPANTCDNAIFPLMIIFSFMSFFIKSLSQLKKFSYSVNKKILHNLDSWVIIIFLFNINKNRDLVYSYLIDIENLKS